MNIIEFCGPPCSGKSYFTKFLILKSKRNNLNSNEIISKYSRFYLNLSVIDKLALSYIKKVKSYNRKITGFKKIRKIKKPKYFKNEISFMLLKRYRKICHELFKKYKKKNPEFVSFYFRLIQQIKIKEKKNNYKLWAEELFAKYHILENQKNLNYNVIFDEGIIQRATILLNFNKDRNILLKKYIKLMPLSKVTIFLDNKDQKLFERSKERSIYNKEFIYRNFKDIKKYKLFFNSFYLNLKKFETLN